MHDSQVAEAIVRHFPARQWVADRAYVSGSLRKRLLTQGAEVVIPPKKNTEEPWHYDKTVYKWRHLIENLFQRLKVFRRLATRYEKRACNYAGIVSLACTLILI